jgi:hypothetical protein
VSIGYFQDGTNLVSMAMNGSGAANRLGGSTCKRTRTQFSISQTADDACGVVQPHERSVTACGNGGGRSRKASMPTRPADRTKRLSSFLSRSQSREGTGICHTHSSLAHRACGPVVEPPVRNV